MDTANSTESPKPEQTTTQIPASTTPNTQSASNVTMPKKRGQISVDKAFVIIYAFVLLAIFAGPILFTDDDTILTPIVILVTVGIPLLIVLIMLHIFLFWQEKKKKR